MSDQSDRDFMIGLVLTLQGNGSHPRYEPWTQEQLDIIGDNIWLQLYKDREDRNDS